MRKHLLLGMIALVAAVFAISGAAGAQEWPAKEPIHVIISNTPGSALDVTARIVFDQVGRQIGQTIVAENKPGAANVIGIAAVAKAAPDGYTVLVTTSGIAIAPYTHKTLPYDTLRDLRAVMPLGNLTNVMITPAGRFKSLKDLVAKAKEKPNALLYASIGPGSTGNLTAERLALSAGFKATQVPFKGTAEGVADLAAGRIDFFFTPITAALGLIREHKSRCARHRQFGPLLADAQSSDHRGGGLSEFRLQFLDRRLRPVGDAAADRGAPARRNPQGAADAGGEGPPRQIRRRTDGHDARSVRGLFQERARYQREAGEGRGHQAAMISCAPGNRRAGG